jgi:hypothetical protein
MKLRDTFTGRDYLVDSGAELCVIPANADDKRHALHGHSLIAANGSKIVSYGKRELALKFGQSSFTQEFIVADVSQPILGANFFAKHHLLIDLAKSRITQVEDWVQIPASPHTYTSEEIGLHEVRQNVYEELLANYPELLVHTIRPNEEAPHRDRRSPTVRPRPSVRWRQTQSG